MSSQNLHLLTLLELGEHDRLIEEMNEVLNVVDVYVSVVQTISGDVHVIEHFLDELQVCTESISMSRRPDRC